jgi:hypothetical protein
VGTMPPDVMTMPANVCTADSKHTDTQNAYNFPCSVICDYLCYNIGAAVGNRRSEAQKAIHRGSSALFQYGR